MKLARSRLPLQRALLSGILLLALAWALQTLADLLPFPHTSVTQWALFVLPAGLLAVLLQRAERRGDCNLPRLLSRLLAAVLLAAVLLILLQGFLCAANGQPGTGLAWLARPDALVFEGMSNSAQLQRAASQFPFIAYNKYLRQGTTPAYALAYAVGSSVCTSSPAGAACPSGQVVPPTAFYLKS